jgi:hypothetical protein
MLHQRKPVITIADPIVRFHHLIVRPRLAELEQRDTRAVLDATTRTFDSKIVGPHFEYLAREWTYWHGTERGLSDIGAVGTATVACREHKGHEIDVVAISRTSNPRTRGAKITVLGEARRPRKPAARPISIGSNISATWLPTSVITRARHNWQYSPDPGQQGTSQRPPRRFSRPQRHLSTVLAAVAPREVVEDGCCQQDHRGGDKDGAHA